VKNDGLSLKSEKKGPLPAPPNQEGFSLTEVVFSLVIFLMIWLPTVSGIVASVYLSSYMKHKVQAMYWAQENMEEQRRSPTKGSRTSTVPLDTQGTIADGTFDVGKNKYFKATGTITIENLDAHQQRVRGKIEWDEKILGGKITVREYYTTDILRDEPDFN